MPTTTATMTTTAMAMTTMMTMVVVAVGSQPTPTANATTPTTDGAVRFLSGSTFEHKCRLPELSSLRRLHMTDVVLELDLPGGSTLSV